MTKFRDYPRQRFILPPGKVTGTYTVVWRGDGSALATTHGAHINDDNKAIDYRGESWLAVIELRRDHRGHVTVDRVYGPRVTRRSNWSDAPPTYKAAIVEAVRAQVQTLWLDAHDVDGRDAGARQRLNSLENEARELASKLAKVRKAIRENTKRLVPEQEGK